MTWTHSVGRTKDVTPCKLSWMISIKATTRIYLVKRRKILNIQTKFDSIKHKKALKTVEVLP